MPRLALLLALAGCQPGADPTGAVPGARAVVADTAAPGAPSDREDVGTITVHVTLGGAPVAGALVSQPGTTTALSTDETGTVRLPLDLRQDVLGVMAAHPDARIAGTEYYELPADGDRLDIALTAFVDRDNPLYVFQDPGTPERNDHTGYCAHCHVTIVDDWVVSAHEQSARNPWVHDLYAGTAAAFSDAAACADAGGRWDTGIGPGTGAPAGRCYLGAGALPDLNADCGETTPCDGIAENTGQCADCHAPGIDGALGGRDLLDATGIAHDHGIHCDVCHKVESVDLESPDPGVAGRLRIVRPSEEGTSPTLGDWQPLTFGPYPDVANPRMGSVARDHFTDARLCAGCHEHWQPVGVVGGTVDTARWPDGLLPVQTTWSELRDGPLGGDPGISCQACHMPPDPDVGNAADLGNVLDQPEGIASGWLREAGSVRRHAWFGPRSESEPMLGLAAELFAETTVEDGIFTATLTTRNVGPGHAIPTGEPLRSLLLLVTARCDGAALVPVGGDVVGDVGGALDHQDPGGDWSRWPGAAVGDRILVTSATGAWRDDPSPAPFSDWAPEDRGLPETTLVGLSTITAVAPDGSVTLDAPLPAGDRAVRLPPDTGLPAEGDPARPWEASPGFSFSKVLVGPDGARHVPHFRAVDVASDNRIPPSAGVTTTHHFDAAACAAPPTVEAVLLWRRAPLALATERGWPLIERELARVIK